MNYLERCLNVRKVASRWYYRFFTTALEENELKEFNEELDKYGVTYEEVNDVMKDYYIDYLEDIIDELKNK